GVVADSPAHDLTILAVKTGTRSPLRLGDELSMRQGDAVYALGAPRGLESSITNGIVSGFRDVDEQFLIQTTAPIAPGSSGGPLFDSSGRVICVTTSFFGDSPGIYFSIGANDIKRLLRTPNLVSVPLAVSSAAKSPDGGSGSSPEGMSPGGTRPSESPDGDSSRVGISSGSTQPPRPPETPDGGSDGSPAGMSSGNTHLSRSPDRAKHYITKIWTNLGDGQDYRTSLAGDTMYLESLGDPLNNVSDIVSCGFHRAVSIGLGWTGDCFERNKKGGTTYGSTGILT